MIGAYKLTEEKVSIIKDLINTGEFTHQQIADIFNVSRPHINKIANGKRWNEDNRSFKMKTANDFREFNDSNLPIKSVELESNDVALDLEQKYYLVKFIESLTGKRIKKLIIEF